MNGRWANAADGWCPAATAAAYAPAAAAAAFAAVAVRGRRCW